MPVTPHIEKHFTATATVRDIVIGMADGLTVPFALAAGLSGAVASSGLVVTAGLAERRIWNITRLSACGSCGRRSIFRNGRPKKCPRFFAAMVCAMNRLLR